MQWAINHISMSNTISQLSIKPLRFQLWQQSIPSFSPFCVCRLTAGRVTSLCPTTGIQLTSTKASDRCPSLTYKARKKKKKKKKSLNVWSVVNIQWIHLLISSGKTTVAVREPNWFFSECFILLSESKDFLSFFLSLQYWVYCINKIVCLSSEGTWERERPSTICANIFMDISLITETPPTLHVVVALMPEYSWVLFTLFSF